MDSFGHLLWLVPLDSKATALGDPAAAAWSLRFWRLWQRISAKCTPYNGGAGVHDVVLLILRKPLAEE